MKNHNKNSRINLRLSEVQKKALAKKAKDLKMTMSQYILELTENGTIQVIEGGTELAEAVYELNRKLGKFDRYPAVQFSELKDVITEGIANLRKLNKRG